ncbi:MAG: hypothetical protein HOV86_07140 [Thermoactinospora sp.]|nr:hypothetical protein [Thermoactinospora sp.]
MPDRWDAFDEAEAEARAMILDPRWSGLAVPVKAQAIAARILATSDGSRWLFGAHGRWHVQDPVDGRWHLAAPPARCPATRVSHPAAVVLTHLIPTGPDCAPDAGSVQGFIGPDVPKELTERIRVLLRPAGRRPVAEYPLTAFTEIFAADVPSTVAAIWGTIMWCAYAPAFDGNERLITVFGEYLGRPLPGDEWVRWIPSPGLIDLATLFAERVRGGGHRAALRLVALMADTAHALVDDARFRPRATALLAMVEPLLRQPDLDDRAAVHGDEAVRHAWLARCPRDFDRAVLGERSPGEAFRHAVYDLVCSLAFATEPLVWAGAFLSELPDPEGRMEAWLDHRLRAAVRRQDPPEATPFQREGATGVREGGTASTDSWELPTGEWAPDVSDWTGSSSRPRPEPPIPTLPSPAVQKLIDREPPDRSTAAAVLGAAYAAAHAWSRLTGVELRQHPGPKAVAERIAHERDDPHVNH